MKKLFISFLLLLFPTMGAWADSHFNVDTQLQYCHKQLTRALQLLRQGGSYDFTMQPRNILSTDKSRGWNCRKVSAEEWCSGFWPGILWMDYSYSHDSVVYNAARGYSETLRPLAHQKIYDHDLGFLINCSLGKGYDVTHYDGYHADLLAAADTLATLFNPVVGTMLSWPRNVKMFGGHNTIMDNMMNLELLFRASAEGGSKLLSDVAIMHATTTMRNHFRPDGSCYHVAVYDTITGQFLRGVNHQGYADYSMWARGQSWAIYGFTVTYRYTHNKLFLDFAQKVANAYLTRLHEISDDEVPIWDFNDPRGLHAPKDASAACVVADALLELSTYVPAGKAKEYRDEAVKMLECLSSKYQSGNRNVAFLLHSTGNLPAKSEIDASIVYADYYYLEALLRLKQLGD